MMEEVKNIYQKLFEVKKAGIKLQRDTKAFNYKYATLSQIQEKFGEVLQEQGLLVIHTVEDNKVVTSIVDIENPLEYKLYSEISLSEGTKAQDKGSEITYYRRYNLLSLLDLEVEDDDGKKASESFNKKAEKKEMTLSNFDAFKKIKDKFATGEDAVKAARTKYKVSGEMAEKIKELY